MLGGTPRAGRAPGRARPPPAVATGEAAGGSPHATLTGALLRAAASGSPLFTFHGRAGAGPVDARDLLERARRWAVALSGAGVTTGARVPILLPGSPDFAGALLGTMLAGAVPAPLATPMTFGSLDRYVENLRAIVADSGARHVVSSGRLLEAIRRDAGLGAHLRDAITPDDARDAAGPAPSPSLDARSPGLLQYTSGTTGRPKGVLLSHGALTHNAFAIQRGLGLGPGDVGVSWLPLYHDMGLIGVLLTAICHPYPIHLLQPQAFVLSPGRWLELVHETGATVSAAPNFAYDLCVRRARVPDALRLDGWRRALNGAEPVHAQTLDRFADAFGDRGFERSSATPVYGLAEATLAVTFSDPEAEPDLLAIDGSALEERGVLEPGDRPIVSVGRPVAGTGVRIVRRDGGVAREGEVGAIEVSGPSLMDGYYGDPDATASVLSDGWLSTGDLGAMLDGRLFVVGREKDVVILNGRNVHPHDVERIATEVEGATGGAAAFGRTDPATGTDGLVVVVETRERDTDRRLRLGRTVRGDLLAVLGVSAEVYLWPVGSIPRTTSGKIRRRACARSLEEGEPR